MNMNVADEQRDADQHGEGVVIDVAGLQLHDAPRDAEHAGGGAVDQPVDDLDVADLPQDAAEPEGRAHEDAVVELVEVPLVEQEQVERPEGARGRAPAATARRCSRGRRGRSRQPWRWSAPTAPSSAPRAWRAGCGCARRRRSPCPRTRSGPRRRSRASPKPATTAPSARTASGTSITGGLSCACS